MGAEAEQQQQLPPPFPQAGKADPPAVVGLQVSALIDHVARVDWSLLDRVPGDRGGSQQVHPDPSLSQRFVHAAVIHLVHRDGLPPRFPFCLQLLSYRWIAMCSCNSRLVGSA